MEHPDLDMNKRYICVNFFWSFFFGQKKNKKNICVNGNNGDIVLMTIKMMTIKMMTIKMMTIKMMTIKIMTIKMMTIKMMTMSLRDRNGVTAYQLAKARNYTGILRLFAKSKLILQVRWS